MTLSVTTSLILGEPRCPSYPQCLRSEESLRHAQIYKSKSKGIVRERNEIGHFSEKKLREAVLVPVQVLVPVRFACKCRRGTRGSPGACGIADAGATHTSSSVVKEVATGSTKPSV